MTVVREKETEIFQLKMSELDREKHDAKEIKKASSFEV